MLEAEELVRSRCKALADDFTVRADKLDVAVEYRGPGDLEMKATKTAGVMLHFVVTSVHEGKELSQKLEALRNKPLPSPRLDKSGPEPRLAIFVRVSHRKDEATPLQGNWYLSADGEVLEGPLPSVPAP